jgi:hypothetical protein
MDYSNLLDKYSYLGGNFYFYIFNIYFILKYKQFIGHSKILDISSNTNITQ